MYGIFTYIYHIFKPNVGKYTIYGSHGLWICFATQHIGSKLLLLHFSRLLKNHINAKICDQVGSVESFHVFFCCWCVSLSRPYRHDLRPLKIDMEPEKVVVWVDVSPFAKGVFSGSSR